MELSVRDALALHPLDRAVVLAGEAGLDRPVAWIQIVEVLGDPFLLARGTLVLTHGSGLDDPLFARRFLSTASSAEVAALAVAAEEQSGLLPTELVALAEELSLPLLGIDPQVDFYDVCRPVVTALLSPTVPAEDSLFLRLASILARGDGLFAMTDEICTTLRATTLVTTRRKRPIASSSCEGEEVLGRYAQLLTNTAGLERIFRSRPLVTISGGPDSEDPPLLLLPIIFDDDIHGALGVATRAPVGETLVQALDGAARAVALQFYSSRLDFECDRGQTCELTQSLLSPPPGLEPATRRRLLNVGFDLERPWRVSLIRAVDDKGTGDVVDPTGALCSLSRHLVRSDHYTPLVTCGPDSITIIMEAHPDGPQAEIEGLTRIHEELFAHFPELAVWIVSGGAVPIGDLDKSRQEAERAMTVAQAHEPTGTVLAFEDLGIDSLLLDLISSPRAAAWVTEVLRPLLAYDAKKKGALLRRTLDTYLALDCNADRTAEKLYLHANTVRYRLRVIEELTGRPLAVQDHRTVFHVALRFLSLMEEDPLQSAEVMRPQPAGKE